MFRAWLLACLTLLIAGCGDGEPSTELQTLPPAVNQPVVVVSARDPITAATVALGRIGKPAVPALTSALADPEVNVRIRACKALSAIGAAAADAVPALTQALSDPQEAVREEAAHALGQIGEAAGPSVPNLLEMMRGKK